MAVIGILFLLSLSVAAGYHYGYKARDKAIFKELMKPEEPKKLEIPVPVRPAHRQLPPPGRLADLAVHPYRPLSMQTPPGAIKNIVIYDDGPPVVPVFPKYLFPLHYVKATVDKVSHEESVAGETHTSMLISRKPTNVYAFDEKFTVGEELYVVVCRATTPPGSGGPLTVVGGEPEKKS